MYDGHTNDDDYERELAAMQRLGRWQERDLGRHPNCRDPDHPGCIYCADLTDLEEEVVGDAHYLDDSLGENDDLRRELCEALVNLHKATQASSGDAVPEAAYGVDEVLGKLASAHAEYLSQQARGEAK